MREEDIRELFRQFATPLAGFVSLGARQGSAEQIARNLWAALLSGPQAEEEVWRAMASTESALADTLKQCYDTEMKPLVTRQQLADLRSHYGIPEPE
jgi:hypothetical protein